MNRELSRHRRMWLAVAVVAIVAASGVMLGQVPATGHHDNAAATSAGQAAAPGSERQRMMQGMLATGQKLTVVVARMNAATGERKVDAIAAVVAELVAQRQQMQEQMHKQGAMMEQMMSRMAAMHGRGGMMQGTPEPKKDVDPDHEAHHPGK